jgi:hypothetical protein
VKLHHFVDGRCSRAADRTSRRLLDACASDAAFAHSANHTAAQPRALAAWVQGHWGIENKLHWVRDVTYDEDRSQIRTGRHLESLAREAESEEGAGAGVAPDERRVVGGVELRERHSARHRGSHRRIR